MSQSSRVHGGPDALGIPEYDFSTNSNASGPCPQALASVQAADATRYPDASYSDLRAEVAEFCGVAPWRIALAGSASEFIYRFTAWARQQGARSVGLPAHAYGDYAYAARAWGLVPQSCCADADLVWACEPSSPLGKNHSTWPAWVAPQCAASPSALGVEEPTGGHTECDAEAAQPTHSGQRAHVVLDCAYAPLRISGTPSISDVQRQQVWQLFSPNKALGLTGIRAAFAIAPLGAVGAPAQLDELAPSWVIGAHGVAMLQAWTRTDTQAWLHKSLQILHHWKQRQVQGLEALGWQIQPSDVPFFCAQPPAGVDVSVLLAALRERGVKLRDATSFGLTGWVRLGALPPVAQDALFEAIASVLPPARTDLEKTL